MDDRLDDVLTELRGIRKEQREIRDEFRKLNGQVASNTQALRGLDGRGGLIDDVTVLKQLVNKFTPGMTSWKNVWMALSAVTVLVGTVAALMFGVAG